MGIDEEEGKPLGTKFSVLCGASVIIILPVIANNNINPTAISQGEKVVYIMFPMALICEVEIKFPSHLVDVDKSICVFPILSVGIKLYITIEKIRANGILLPV